MSTPADYENFLAARTAFYQQTCGSTVGVESLSAEDQFFLVVMGALVFFMQAGFAMLEAGSIESHAVTSVLFKNVCDVLVGALAWWAVGWAFAFGNKEVGSGDDRFSSTADFIGTGGYFLDDVNECTYPFWFYQWTFAATATTIVSGAMAGRTQLAAYLAYSLVLTGFVYPVVVHWVWSYTDHAWLATGRDGVGFKDFAGSGVVHCTGGMAALVGAVMVGPRANKVFDKNKTDIAGHSMPLVAVGTLILFFGFIGFNGGSVLTHHANAPDNNSLGVAVVNTVLAAMGGGLAAELFNVVITRRKYWSLMQMCNGLIAGMVAICASADTNKGWAAFCIGVGGGISYKVWSIALHMLKIDDAIDAVGVHLGAGLWGLVAAAFFPPDGTIFYDGQQNEAWELLAWQLAGGIVIMVWVGSMSFLLFFVLNKFNALRVPDEIISRLDVYEHGENAYVFDEVYVPDHVNVSRRQSFDALKTTAPVVGGDTEVKTVGETTVSVTKI